MKILLSLLFLCLIAVSSQAEDLQLECKTLLKSIVDTQVLNAPQLQPFIGPSSGATVRYSDQLNTGGPGWIHLYSVSQGMVKVKNDNKESPYTYLWAPEKDTGISLVIFVAYDAGGNLVPRKKNVILMKKPKLSICYDLNVKEQHYEKLAVILDKIIHPENPLIIEFAKKFDLKPIENKPPAMIGEK